jgi:hypothetical protein
VAIGLVFVYLLLALICTTLMEWFARIFDRRGKMLVKGIRQLLGETEQSSPLTNEILSHPLISGTLGPGLPKKPRLPSYVDPRLFARALADVAGAQQAGAGNPRLREAFQALNRQTPLNAQNAVPPLPLIEEWFTAHMDRVTGWYKRHTQTVILVLALLVTIATNADTLSIARRLYRDPVLRQSVLEGAKTRIQQGPPASIDYIDPTTPKEENEVENSANRLLPSEEETLGNVLGYTKGDTFAFGDIGRVLGRHWLGWILTILAVSLGAPFWFDALSWLVNIRSAGVTPDDRRKQRPKPAEAQS